MIREFSWDLSRSLNNLESLESIRIVIKNRVSKRFNLDNIGYFDLFYKSKFVDIIFIIEYIDKSIFFYNIYIFINRIKDIV